MKLQLHKIGRPTITIQTLILATVGIAQTHTIEITPDASKLLNGMWQTVNCQASTLEREEPLDADRPVTGVYPYSGDCVKMLFGGAIYNENGVEGQSLDGGVGSFSFYYSAIYRAICDFELKLTFTNSIQSKEYIFKANDSMMLDNDPIAQRAVLSDINLEGEVTVRIEIDTTGSIYTTTDPALIWNMEWTDYDSDGVGDIMADESTEAEYYDLAGRPTDCTSPGLYLCRKGAKITKLIVR